MRADDVATLPVGKAADAAAQPSTERYVLRERLGEGGMGVVWSARDTALGRDVALKLLHDRFLGADHQRRLAEEARTMARLSHPNVVAVYDVGEREGRTFVAMELVAGRSLARWLDTPRDWREIVALFRDAARGLAAAHAAGIVHRDVKPGNLLVGDDGRVRVADFGVAHAGLSVTAPTLSTTIESVETPAATGGLVGTPVYMAIEQLCGEAADPRSDQFSLCVALYEAIHGRRPFDTTAHGDARIGALVLAIARGAPRGPREVPRWLDRAIRRGLSADPTARFPSMDAFAAALAGPRSRTRIYAAAGLAAAGVLAGALYLARDTSSPPPSGAPTTPPSSAAGTSPAATSPAGTSPTGTSPAIAPGTSSTSTPSTGTPSTSTPSTSTPSTGTPSTGTPSTGTPSTGTTSTGRASTGTPSTGTTSTGTVTASTGTTLTGTPSSTTASTGTTPPDPTSTGRTSAGTPSNQTSSGTTSTGRTSTGTPSTGTTSTGTTNPSIALTPHERTVRFDALVADAKVAFGARNFRRSFELFEQAAAIEPTDPDGHAGAATSACRLGDLAAARRHLAAIPQSRPDNRIAIVRSCRLVGANLDDQLTENEREHDR